MERKQEDTIDLLKLCKVLLNKAWLLIIVALLFAIVSFVVTKNMIKPEYQATSKLYVFNKSDVGTSGAVSSSDISTSKILVNTYIVVLQSDSVLGQVVDTISEYQGKEGFEYLGTEPYTTGQLRQMISAGSINSTESFSVTVTAHDPYQAKFINDAILYFLPDEINEKYAKILNKEKNVIISPIDYLNESIVRPYSTVQRGYGDKAPATVNGYFEWLIEQHNAQVKPNKQFTVGINQGGQLVETNYIFRESNQYPTTIE